MKKAGVCPICKIKVVNLKKHLELHKEYELLSKMK